MKEKTLNEVIIILNDVNSYSKEVRVFKGKLTDKDFEAAKKAHGCYINSVDQNIDKYKALEYFYNEVLTSYDEEKDEFKFMLDEVEQPEKLDGTIILIGFVN